jgi:spermidine synthase
LFTPENANVGEGAAPMTSKQAKQPVAPVTNRYLPGLVLLFVGSGSAALIYEIVWFQLLSLTIGSSAVSMGVLLGTFMAGMCIGSLYLSRFVSAKEHPLRVYAMLEAGIGLFGLVILFALPWVGGLYTAIGGGGFSGMLIRGLVCAICLLPPTIMMGATLPAIARWVEATPEGVSWLGFFYGGNIAGAVTGSLLAGFYLLRVHDMMIATFVAVAINGAVAAIGFGLAKIMEYTPRVDDTKPEATKIPPGAWPIFIAIGISGMTALGAEVLWTRLLTLLLGGTVYTFSLILAAFLLGLGIGSGVGSFFARSVKNPRAALGWCQLLLTIGIAWAAYALTQGLPFWPINPELTRSPVYTFQIDLARCLWTVLPSALLWGASFPLALAAVAERTQDTGRLVGRVYAANTVGAIIGSLVASLIIIEWLGTQNGQRLLIVFAAISALLVLVPVVTEAGKLELTPRGFAYGIVTLILAGWLAAGVRPVPGLLIAYGRYMVTWLNSAGEVLFADEGMNSSMAVTQFSNGIMNYHNAGKVQASSDPVDMRLQRMLGHLTTLLPENPRNILVIGCGAGVTAGAVSIDPAVEKVTIAEIEKLVPEVVSRWFSEHNYAVVTNPKVQVKIDDARHYLLTSDEKYDAITSDPFDPWVKGAATLYTREFFQVVRNHLNPGGVVTVFVQFYESSEAAVKSEIATFFEVFPDGAIFANTADGKGYDVVLVGRNDPNPIDIDRIEQRLRDPANEVIARSLSEIGIYSALDLFSTYAGRASELKPWLADAQINRDRNLRLQYLAGLGLNLYQQDAIYRAMLPYRRYPEDLFTGSQERIAMLRSMILGGP